MTTTAPVRPAAAPTRVAQKSKRRGLGLLAAILIVLPLIVAGAALVSVNLRSSERNALALEAATGLYNAGDYALAAEAFQQVIEQGADAPSVYYSLGMAALQAGDAPRAVDALERASADSPRNTEFARALEQARNRVTIEATNQGLLASPALQPEEGIALQRQWQRWLSLNETALVALIAWCALAGMVCIALLKPGWRLLAILGAILAGVLLVVSIGMIIL